MRIALVSPFDPNPPVVHEGRAHVGGVERVFQQFSRALAQRGHEVTLVCSTDGPDGTAQEDGVRVVRERRRGVLMRTPMASLTRSLPRDVDLVHVAATYPFTTPFVLLRARRLGLPAVLDFHFEPSPGGAIGAAVAGLYRQLGPRTYPLAQAVLVRSRAYARSARSLAAVPETLWHVVPNGVDTQRFRPRGRAPPGDHLLFVGRLVPYKGLEVLLRALAILRPGLPLHIAGEGPLRERLETRAKELGVDVLFLGRVDDEDLPDLYRRARLTLLPSVNHQEAFGMVLVESMACGTPVVASALPGVEEVALHGGLVAPPGDAAALAETIRRALEPGALPRGAALAGPVRRAFSWDAVTDRLEEAYARVLAPAAGAAEVNLPAHPVGHTVP